MRLEKIVVFEKVIDGSEMDRMAEDVTLKLDIRSVPYDREIRPLKLFEGVHKIGEDGTVGMVYSWEKQDEGTSYKIDVVSLDRLDAEVIAHYPTISTINVDIFTKVNGPFTKMTLETNRENPKVMGIDIVNVKTVFDSMVRDFRDPNQERIYQKEIKEKTIHYGVEKIQNFYMQIFT